MLYRPNLVSLLLVCATLLGFTASCDLAKQASQLLAFTRCQYELAGVSGMALAGVPMDGKSLSNGLSFTETATLGLAYLGGNVPLSMNVNLNVFNNQKDTASLNQVDYFMTLEGTPLASGSLPRVFKVAPGNTGTLPIPINVNLLTAFSGKSQIDLLNLVLALAGQSSEPTNLGLRIRPYFVVSGQTVKFPNYFTVNTTLGSDSL